MIHSADEITRHKDDKAKDKQSLTQDIKQGVKQSKKDLKQEKSRLEHDIAKLTSDIVAEHVAEHAQHMAALQADSIKPTSKPEPDTAAISEPLSVAKTTDNAAISVEGDGLRLSAIDTDDAIVLTDVATDEPREGFVYSADVKFNGSTGAAALVFNADDSDDEKRMYVANINGASGECRVFKFGDTNGISYDDAGNITSRDAIDLAPWGHVPLAEDGEYYLSVTMVGKHILFSVNGHTVINTGDYMINPTDATAASYGQNKALLRGKLGVMTWNGDVSYHNVKHTALDAKTTPRLSSLSLIGDGVDMNLAFQESSYLYIGYVRHDTKSVGVRFSAAPGAIVTARGIHGQPLPISKDNTFILPTPRPGENRGHICVYNGEARLEYKLRVFREAADDTYFHEDWRCQYHWSVKNGWGNDPCGLVYYKEPEQQTGTWHFFYQFYTGVVWGPMHWGHATSVDLLHWSQQPVALYPDEYGSMYSGCAVIANNATAPSLFLKGESGIVLFTTANGVNGSDRQRVILASSTDGGHTFEKVEAAGVVIDATEGENRIFVNKDGSTSPTIACRDPKVFRFDDRWFMVLAGGPLRIYSSRDLVNWQLEAAHPEIDTECPDLYPVQASDGTVRWVLSLGGLYYRLGMFSRICTGTRWHYDFIGEDKGVDHVMNFGANSYAAMTYYQRDFGRTGAVVCPDIISMCWMSTWKNAYCNAVSPSTENDIFCGTYNLLTEQTLVRTRAGWRLAQTPLHSREASAIDAAHAGYEVLRDDAAALKLTGVTLGPDDKTFEGFHQTSYVIDATFRPEDKTSPKVGFKARVGPGQQTCVTYDFADGCISINRSDSGIHVIGKKGGLPDGKPYDTFTDVHSKACVPRDPDGSISLHIYVDRASIEVFTADYTVCGADQIFPSPFSDGLSAFCQNGSATLDLSVCPLFSIWSEQCAKRPSTKPTKLYVSATTLSLSAGTHQEISAWVAPAAANQELMVICSDPTVATCEHIRGGLRLCGVTPGQATLTLTATTNTALVKVLTVNVI